MKKNSLNIDAAISFYNINVKPKNKQPMTRLELGKIVLPGAAEATINNTLSHWANGASRTRPTVEQIKKIAKATHAPLELILNL